MLDLHLVIKPKRNYRRCPKVYLDIMRELESLDNVTIIDERVSAFRVVKHSKAVIAQPFSSAGYYLDANPAICFYDPYHIIPNCHSAVTGQDLCIGIERLKVWLESVMK